MNKENIRIFIVDDNSTNIKILSQVVSKEGFTNINKYTDPRQALDEFSEYSPHLVLLDMQMPDINGIQFLQRIQDKIVNAQVAVIVLTATNDKQLRQEALSLGALDYIEKPFNIAETIQRIQNVLHLQSKKQDLEELSDELDHELQQTNNSLKGIKDTLKVLFSESSEFVFILDEKNNIIDANKVACDKFNFSLSDCYSLPKLLAITESDIKSAKLTLTIKDDNSQLIMECKHSALLIDNHPHSIFIGKDVTGKEQDKTKLTLMAQTHYISGLPNRFQLKKQVQQQFFSNNNQQGVVFLFISFFDAGKVSQRYGPKAHHQYIVSSAQALADIALLFTANILHWSEHEYVMICRDSVSMSICKSIESRFIETKNSEKFRGSSIPKIGCYSLEQGTNGTDYSAYVHYASLAAHQGLSKNNHITQYSEALRNELEYKTTIENGLFRAVQSGSFKMAYQPLIDLNTNITIGVEALIRWEFGELGMIPPDFFIPVAEKSGLIEDIGTEVIELVLHDFHHLKKLHPGLQHVAINVAAPQCNQRLVTHLKNGLKKHDVAASQIKLEITETSFLDNFEEVSALLVELNELGFLIALDDFGTGFSSLSYLHQLPVDTLKIDRSFITGVHDSEKSYTLVKSIISMSHSLGLTIVAEGIEDEKTSDLLKALGVQIGQGYFYAKPGFIN